MYTQVPETQRSSIWAFKCLPIDLEFQSSRHKLEKIPVTKQLDQSLSFSKQLSEAELHEAKKGRFLVSYTFFQRGDVMVARDLYVSNPRQIDRQP